jgi:hypothetical protein
MLSATARCSWHFPGCPMVFRPRWLRLSAFLGSHGTQSIMSAMPPVAACLPSLPHSLSSLFMRRERSRSGWRYLQRHWQHSQCAELGRLTRAVIPAFVIVIVTYNGRTLIPVDVNTMSSCALCPMFGKLHTYIPVPRDGVLSCA